MSFTFLEPKEPSVIVEVLTVSRHLWKKVSPTVKWASNLSVMYGSKKLLVRQLSHFARLGHFLLLFIVNDFLRG